MAPSGGIGAVGRRRECGAVCVGGGRRLEGKGGVCVWEGRHCVCGRQRKACTCRGIASGDGGEGKDAATGSAGGLWVRVCVAPVETCSRC